MSRTLSPAVFRFDDVLCFSEWENKNDVYSNCSGRILAV